MQHESDAIGRNYLPEETLIRRGIKALMADLGPVETARFLSLSRERQDYAIWRREWQETLDPDSFLDEIFGNN